MTEVVTKPEVSGSWFRQGADQVTVRLWLLSLWLFAEYWFTEDRYAMTHVSERHRFLKTHLWVLVYWSELL